jgi:hypothetical protein
MSQIWQPARGVIRQVQVLPVAVPPNGKIEATVLR